MNNYSEGMYAPYPPISFSRFESQAAFSPAFMPGKKPFVSCQIIQCGTSRVIVLQGHELPADENELQSFILKILIGDEHTLGIKGDHYQFNKIAIVYPGEWASRFRFRFFQLDPKANRLIPNLECANLAAGAALAALSGDLVRLDEFGTLRAQNLGTGQEIELAPLDIRNIWSCNWRIRFLVEVDISDFSNSFIPRQFELAEGQYVEYWITERGNVFFLVNLHPDYVDSELIDAITEAGREQIEKLDFTREKMELPKVIFYSLQSAGYNRASLSAVCYFKGQQHQSLPGSGSMCLASFLTCSLLMENGVPVEHGNLIFDIWHPSGFIEVSAGWETYQGRTFLSSTEFATTLKLLISGSLAIH